MFISSQTHTIPTEQGKWQTNENRKHDQLSWLHETRTETNHASEKYTNYAQICRVVESEASGRGPCRAATNLEYPANLYLFLCCVSYNN